MEKVDYINTKREDLPKWLLQLWRINPELAEKAEIDYISLKKQLAIPRVSVSLPSLEDYKELLEASKQAYTSIRHETNPSNTQLDAYFRLEKILKTIKGNER